jgi:hypothetical protein
VGRPDGILLELGLRLPRGAGLRGDRAAQDLRPVLGALGGTSGRPAARGAARSTRLLDPTGLLDAGGPLRAGLPGGGRLPGPAGLGEHGYVRLDRLGRRAPVQALRTIRLPRPALELAPLVVSSGPRRVMAVPARPIRPVRPIRWVSSSDDSGSSTLMTWSRRRHRCHGPRRWSRAGSARSQPGNRP